MVSVPMLNRSARKPVLADPVYRPASRASRLVGETFKQAATGLVERNVWIGRMLDLGGQNRRHPTRTANVGMKGGGRKWWADPDEDGHWLVVARVASQ